MSDEQGQLAQSCGCGHYITLIGVTSNGNITIADPGGMFDMDYE